MKPQSSHNELKTEILNRITTEQICPRSRLFFRSRECFIWTIWLVTVVIGAIAVALLLTAIMVRQSDLYELTHDSWFEAVREAIPYLWVVVFGSMVVAAIYNLRYTKQGYRYPLWKIFGSSVVFSLAGGALLHLVGAGMMLDERLGEQLSHYESQAKHEQKLWQQPEQGRLVGLSVGSVGDVPTQQFTDVSGTSWSMDIGELAAADTALLQSGEKVRVLGELLTLVPPRFYACGVFPWLYSHNMSLAEMNREQEALRQKFYTQFLLANDSAVEQGASRCANHLKIKQLRSR